MARCGCQYREATLRKPLTPRGGPPSGAVSYTHPAGLSLIHI
ncbi:hypothetical protein [Arthrobacter sp. KBS0703]|nr:hypothetical protein [Arthrobacter sp. KBS0703]